MTEHTALYVYALLRDRPDAADGVTGIDGHPLRLVRVPGTSVAALVHDALPAPLQGNDEQVRRWVEEQSRAVNTVWERTGSVLPMTFNVLVAEEPPAEDRLATGRSAERRLTEWITEQAADITGRLEELTGRCELRVDITVDRTAVTTDEAGEDAPEGRPDGLSPGMRRLMAKQREHRARNAAGRLADTLHAETRHRLLSIAEDYRDRGPTHRAADETDVLCAAAVASSDATAVSGAAPSSASSGAAQAARVATESAAASTATRVCTGMDVPREKCVVGCGGYGVRHSYRPAGRRTPRSLGRTP